MILLSGGLDSSTALAVARADGFECYALTVKYGQLHEVELVAAARVAAALGATDHRVVAVDLSPLAHSALTTAGQVVPKDRSMAEIGAPGDVPSTYVPARNTVLLSLALAWAETLGAKDLFVGVNVLDASGYPDCRPEFVRAFEALAQVATPRGRLPRARAADRSDQGRHHQARDAARRRLRDHAQLLRPGRRRRVRSLRRLPAAQEGVRRGGRPRSDALLSYDRPAMKLGTLLLRNAAIGLTQLEGALRNQVLYGGRLGTNLVELGFIDLELLSTYLSEMSAFPAATPSLLDEADKRLLEKLGVDDAHRLRAVPLAERDGKIAVAMVDPTDDEALAELKTLLGGKDIAPHVVPELRALYYLEKLFGLPRRARFIRTGRIPVEDEPPEVPPEVSTERRRSVPAKGLAMPPRFTLEPRKRRASAAPLIESVPPIITYGAACEKIDSATHRDQIAESFVAYAQGRVDALVVFLIRDGNALGWRGYASTKVVKPIEELSLPLGGTSALQDTHDSGQVFVGTPPSGARPVETALWSALSAVPEPIQVFVVPVLVKQRPVNLVYGHLLAAPPAPALIAELSDLAQRAQTSYQRLIQQARGQ